MEINSSSSKFGNLQQIPDEVVGTPMKPKPPSKSFIGNRDSANIVEQGNNSNFKFNHIVTNSGFNPGAPDIQPNQTDPPLMMESPMKQEMPWITPK